jgi:hypothetical protein
MLFAILWDLRGPAIIKLSLLIIKAGKIGGGNSVVKLKEDVLRSVKVAPLKRKKANAVANALRRNSEWEHVCMLNYGKIYSIHSINAIYVNVRVLRNKLTFHISCTLLT